MYPVENGFAGRAARRIDPGETAFDAKFLPSRSGRVRAGPSGQLRRAYLPLFPWSTRHLAALWRKRHGKRPRGEPLPPFACLHTMIDAGRMTRVTPRQESGYRHACLQLRAEARPSPRIGGRRRVPPAIAMSGPQTGRERPRVWNANLFPATSHGVAHVPSAGWQPRGATASEAGADSVAPPHPRVTRRATRLAREAVDRRRDLCPESGCLSRSHGDAARAV